MIHRPTFNPSADLVLTLSMCAIGVLYSGLEGAKAFAKSLSELLRRLLIFMVSANLHDRGCRTHLRCALSSMSRMHLPVEAIALLLHKHCSRYWVIARGVGDSSNSATTIEVCLSRMAVLWAFLHVVSRPRCTKILDYKSVGNFGSRKSACVV